MCVVGWVVDTVSVALLPAVILSSGELCLCGCGVVMLSSLSLLRCSESSGNGVETTPDTIKVNVSTLCVCACMHACVHVCICVCVRACVCT